MSRPGVLVVVLAVCGAGWFGWWLVSADPGLRDGDVETPTEPTRDAGSAGDTAERDAGSGEPVDRSDASPGGDLAIQRTALAPAEVFVRVLDEDGGGLAAEVAFIPAQELEPTSSLAGRRELLELARRRSVAVPEEGRSLERVRIGPGLLLVLREGYQAWTDWLGLQGAPIPPELTISLRASRSVYGTVVDDATDQPVPGAQLRARPRVDDGSTAVEVLLVGCDATADEDGFFELIDLGDRLHTITCEAEGFASSIVELVPADQDVEVRLCGPIGIHGIVHDAEGEPLPDVKVVAASRGLFPAAGNIVQTDEEGGYLVEGVPAGPFVVKVYSHEHEFASREFDGTRRDRSIDFELKPAVAFKGKLVDDRGQPIAGGQVVVNTASGIRQNVGSMTTKEDGSWWMVCVGESQLYNVEAVADGHYAIATIEEVRAPQEELVLVLPRDATLAGRVVGPDGAPVPRYSIQLIPEFSWQHQEQRFLDADQWSSFTSDDEPFELGMLWPRPSRLNVEAAGFSRQSMLVELTPGETTEIEVRLERAHVVAGRVIGADGSGIEGASVQIGALDSRGSVLLTGAPLRSRTDPGGAFQLEQAPEGVFDLVVRHRDLGHRVLHDQRAEDFPRDLRLLPPGQVRGRVLSPWTHPDTCLSVRARPAGTQAHVEGVLMEGGEFLLGPLQPGTWVVGVSDAYHQSERYWFGEVTRTVQVASGQESFVEIDARHSGTIQGQLVLGESKLRSDQVVARLFDDEASLLALDHPLDTGHFVFCGLADGDYEVQLCGGDPGVVLDLRSPVTVRDGRGRVELRIAHDGASGSVRDQRGEPLRALVTLFDTGRGERGARSITDGRGQFWLHSKIPPASILGASSPGHADRYLQDPEADPIEIVMETEARLDVRVVNQDDVELPGASLVLELPRHPAPFRRRTEVALEGRHRFTRLPAGPVQAWAQLPGHLPAGPIPQTLVSGQDSTLTLTLVQYGSIDVHFADEDLPTDHQVTISDPQGCYEERRPSSDRRSTLRFTEVPPGTWQVNAHGDRVLVEVASGQRSLVEWPGAGEADQAP